RPRFAPGRGAGRGAGRRRHGPSARGARRGSTAPREDGARAGGGRRAAAGGGRPRRKRAAGRPQGRGPAPLAARHPPGRGRVQGHDGPQPKVRDPIARIPGPGASDEAHGRRPFRPGLRPRAFPGATFGSEIPYDGALAPLKEGAVASRPQPVRRTVERRNNGLLRVPFIRRCALAFDDGTSASTFTVNINVLGAYVARDQMPQLSQAVTITLATPGKDVQLVLRG